MAIKYSQNMLSNLMIKKNDMNTFFSVLWLVKVCLFRFFPGMLPYPYLGLGTDFTQDVFHGANIYLGLEAALEQH